MVRMALYSKSRFDHNASDFHHELPHQLNGVFSGGISVHVLHSKCSGALRLFAVCNDFFKASIDSLEAHAVANAP